MRPFFVALSRASAVARRVLPRVCRPSTWLIAALVFSAGLSLSAAAPGASSVPLDSEVPANITVTPVVDRWDGRGFLPLRVRIENRGARDLAWTMSFSTGIGFGGDSLSCDARLGAKGGETTETVMFVPGVGALGGGQRTTLNIRAEGPGAARAWAFLLHGNNEVVLSTATIPRLEGALFSATHGAPGDRTEITAVDPSSWPADWRVWAPFQRVVLTDSELAALDGARQAALRDWVAMGGVLDVYPETNRGREEIESHGLGVTRRRARSLTDEANDAKVAVTLPVSRIHEIYQLYRDRAPMVPAERRQSLEPKRGTLSVALFLVGFGVLVGPVNLFVFAPASRRHRLFFTVPAISLAASVLLSVYIVVQDGFGGEGAITGTVFLLPETNQAVVTQNQISRTGVMAGTGFELADDVILEQGGARSGAWPQFDRGERAEFFHRSQGRASGDWFASRRVQDQTLKRLAPTRARVELVSGGQAGEAPVVQSSVGAVLREFCYVDESGTVWGTNELAPGRKVTLERRVNPVGLGKSHAGYFSALGGAAEGLTPIPTLSSVRWDAPQFLFVGPLVGARKP